MKLEQYIKTKEAQLLNYFIRQLCLHLKREVLDVEGIMRFRRIPDDWSEATYRYWWLPEWNEDHTKIIRPARMGPIEKERYTVEEFHNILTTQGRTYILTYMSSSTPNTPAWAQQFAVGTFPLTAVSPGDTSV